MRGEIGDLIFVKALVGILFFYNFLRHFLATSKLFKIFYDAAYGSSKGINIQRLNLLFPSKFNKPQWGQLPLVGRRNCQPSNFVRHTRRPRTRPNFKTNATCPLPFRTELKDKISQIGLNFFQAYFVHKLNLNDSKGNKVGHSCMG